MAKTSTLIYLVDDLNLPSDMLLNQNIEPQLTEKYDCSILDFLEIDPGDELVTRTLKFLEVK